MGAACCQGSLGYLIDRAAAYEMPYKRMLSRVPEVMT